MRGNGRTGAEVKKARPPRPARAKHEAPRVTGRRRPPAHARSSVWLGVGHAGGRSRAVCFSVLDGITRVFPWNALERPAPAGEF